MNDPGTDPYVPGHGDPVYDVEHYDLDLHYRPQGNRLTGEAVLRCRGVETSEVLRLDLAGLTAQRVTVSGRRVRRFQQRDAVLVVRLEEEIAAGEEFTLTVKYAGNPRPLSMKHLGSAGWEELEDGAIVAAQPHGAPTWFPCNDRPTSKATYVCTIAVPADYVAVFSGEEVSSVRSGAHRTRTFRQEAPMATYLATLQIGRYTVREQSAVVPLRVVAPAGVTGPGFDASFGLQPQMMAFFVDRFGPYPFSTYTSVITDDDLEIPLESQSLSTFGRNFADGAWDNVRLVAHEMAHQWFGNAVTLGAWRDIWLHEGFACYAEWLWSEESGSDTADQWARHHHGRLADLDQDLLLSDPGPDLMFDDRVYKRGALTLHALRGEVGDDVFFDLLRSWVAEHRGGSVSTPQFVAHCSAAAGRDLAPLFDAWVHATPLPPLPS